MAESSRLGDGGRDSNSVGGVSGLEGEAGGGVGSSGSVRNRAERLTVGGGTGLGYGLGG